MVEIVTFRRSAYAVTTWANVARFGSRCPGHWRASTLSSSSAILSQLPCFGVWCHSSRSVSRRAS